MGGRPVLRGVTTIGYLIACPCPSITPEVRFYRVVDQSCIYLSDPSLSLRFTGGLRLLQDDMNRNNPGSSCKVQVPLLCKEGTGEICSNMNGNISAFCLYKRLRLSPAKNPSCPPFTKGRDLAARYIQYVLWFEERNPAHRPDCWPAGLAFHLSIHK